MPAHKIGCFRVEAGGINSDRNLWQQDLDFLRVLNDQFFSVLQDDYLSTEFDGLFRQHGDYQRLARTRRKND
jgi:hypothetical protein